MLKKLSIILQTNRLAETIEFYTHILLFECDQMDVNSGWVLLRKNEVVIKFISLTDISYKEPIVLSGSLYLHSNNLKKEWELVKDLAVVDHTPHKNNAGIQEFSIRDNNGYLLTYGQNA